MGKKTQAMRVLEGRGIQFTSLTYNKNERDAVTIAAEIGMPPDKVFKTLVVVRKANKPLLVMVPADRQLSLKKLAAQIGEKKVQMATQAEAERLTGLQVGGISPLALLNKGFLIVLDKSALASEEIVISAGQRGIQIQLAANDLMLVTKARLLEVAD